MKSNLCILSAAFLVVFSTPSSFSAVPKVSIYYESLCPYCQDFFLHQLGPTYEALKGHMEMELVPFGNVNVTESSDGQREYHCQHGPRECLGNLVHSCGLALINDKDEALKFILCNFEEPNFNDTHHFGEQCAKEMHLDWAKLKSCIEGHQGDQLIEANWKKTASLSPPHKGVPWLLIDDVHTDVIQEEARNHLQEFLCSKYLNSDNLPACKH